MISYRVVKMSSDVYVVQRQYGNGTWEDVSGRSSFYVLSDALSLKHDLESREEASHKVVAIIEGPKKIKKPKKEDHGKS